MRSIRLWRWIPLLCALAASPLALAQEDDDEQEVLDSMVVTGTRIMGVSAGGAQDIGHFRQLAEAGEIPRFEGLTVEGLLNEHDLALPLARPCEQLLCLATEAMAQGLPSRSADRMFVGLGFTSNVEADGWQRQPLNLVAVVDHSGSMSGPPLALVREALRQVAGQMRAGDRLAIVLYGDAARLYLPSVALPEARAQALAAIDGIQSNGSTYMEAGLKLGFETARAAARGFSGTTRVMLFTDEQPNVGAVDADSFMGLAEAAARDGIGMTTIGVGVQYDGELATQISSVRGGNLFFVADPDGVQQLFHEELDTMVSAIAHDIRITLQPVRGYRISGIYGVPGDLMEEGDEGAVEIHVPSAFFSTQSGGIFLSLAQDRRHGHLPAPRLRASQPLLRLALRYESALDGSRARDQLDVAQPKSAPSTGLRTAFALVDQFLVMRDASRLYHRNDNPREAYRRLSALQQRLEQDALPGLAAERALVAQLTAKAALMSGYAGEVSGALLKGAIQGSWTVTRARGATAIHKGEQWDFREGTLERWNQEGESIADERFTFDGRALELPESGLRFSSDYRREGLVLNDVGRGTRIVLTPVRGETAQ